ncbi:hypothetical protein EV363DRAFT_1400724 [Boletus edulis]|nr:hypothetical protein EV363DRAFT_1400724 [Boletus edulis]
MAAIATALSATTASSTTLEVSAGSIDAANGGIIAAFVTLFVLLLIYGYLNMMDCRFESTGSRTAESTVDNGQEGASMPQVPLQTPPLCPVVPNTVWVEPATMVAGGSDTHLFPIPGERGENGELRTQSVDM